ncbi:MAG: bifunctional phosphopantothenoylcysteine decarboxylase/phosphopantothenate--cysteine ligase CoaBC [Lachnospiraceae bacterium]|nr:bifunctional phosphopantothenoylcysteine decarboxylase/phosphopantothenate--cysteine ligase CoaBC [Lachnospiraceae bacterium]
MDVLKGKNIIVGVTGSIAAYKAADLCSMLIKRGAAVTVIMTANAVNFINPITFETLTGRKCLTDTFDRNFDFKVEHIELAKQADLMIIAPASANIIAKAANGIADDMLSTTILSCTCPKLFSPAMNTRMLKNPVTQDNLKKLEGYGMEVISPASGHLACGDSGEGKLPDCKVLLECIEDALTEKILKGRRVLVTAGPTREKLDPVRFITNHSSGKMGYSIAKMARRMGASVTLVSGKCSIEPPAGVEFVDVESAADMAEAVKSRADKADIIIKAAAVADYRPATTYDEKVKKSDGDMSIPLERTEDILGYLGAHRRDDQFLCGFSMETENLIENSRAKLDKKNLDMIVANNLKVEGAGFGVDTNVVTLITREGMKELPVMSKDEVAGVLLEEINGLRCS